MNLFLLFGSLCRFFERRFWFFLDFWPNLRRTSPGRAFLRCKIGPSHITRDQITLTFINHCFEVYLALSSTPVTLRAKTLFVVVIVVVHLLFPLFNYFLSQIQKKIAKKTAISWSFLRPRGSKKVILIKNHSKEAIFLTFSYLGYIYRIICPSFCLSSFWHDLSTITK